MTRCSRILCTQDRRSHQESRKANALREGSVDEKTLKILTKKREYRRTGNAFTGERGPREAFHKTHKLASFRFHCARPVKADEQRRTAR